MYALGIDFSDVAFARKVIHVTFDDVKSTSRTHTERDYPQVSDVDSSSTQGRAKSPLPSPRPFAQERLAQFGALMMVERVGRGEANSALYLSNRRTPFQQIESADTQDFVRVFVK